MQLHRNTACLVRILQGPVARMNLRNEAQDKAKRQEEEAILDLYLSALGEI